MFPDICQIKTKIRIIDFSKKFKIEQCTNLISVRFKVLAYMIYLMPKIGSSFSEITWHLMSAEKNDWRA